jgi:transcriptional regulator with PAS, ATPase and Fis domain
VKQRYHLSPYVIIPVVFAGLTVLSGLVVKALSEQGWANPEAGRTWTFIWLWFVALVAFVTGIAFVHVFLRPIREFIKETESLPEFASPEDHGGRAGGEDDLTRFSRLSRRVVKELSRQDAEDLFPEVIGRSKAIRSVLAQVMKVAPTEATVLIVGESGVGKELIATGIHQHSKRAHRPLVKVNCAAIAENLIESELFGHEKGAFTGAIKRQAGKFELAHTGTLFLDEIGDMPLDTQAKILRAIQEKEIERVGGQQTISVDVRFIAASNQDLAALVEAGRFRKDLFYRLNVVTLFVPPLRERLEDLPLLTEHFLTSGPKDTVRISNQALRRLWRYDWPGNVRELKNALEQAAVMCEDGLIEPGHLPEFASPESPGPPIGDQGPIQLDQHLQNMEKDIIVDALRRNDGVQARAAEQLGISQRSLWHRVKKFEIDVKKIKAMSND